MVLDIELGVYQVLNLLFLPRLTLFKQVKQTLSLLLSELRGTAAPEARGKESKTPFFQSFAQRLPVD